VIALFASADFETLPWLLFQQAGRYRVDEAAATAVILMLVVVMLFGLGHGLGRWLSLPRSLYRASDMTTHATDHS
jgi:thiamine transport system permease protein